MIDRLTQQQSEQLRECIRMCEDLTYKNDVYGLGQDQKHKLQYCRARKRQLLSLLRMYNAE